MEPPAPTISFAPLSLDEFPGASTVLSAFDDRTAEPDWSAHDQVLFALRLDRGGEAVRWLLHIDVQRDVAVSATEPVTDTSIRADGSASISLTSRAAAVAVKVFRPDAVLLNETSVVLPASHLGQGLLPSIRAAAAGAVAEGKAINLGETIRLVMQGFFTLNALLDVVRENDVLADYFWQVVDTPGLWSVVTNFGVSVSVVLSFEKSVVVPVPAPLPPAGQAFSVPLRIDVNDSPALFVDLLAADASRPYALCGGIVAAVARHPTRSDVMLRMQLIAARCGAAKQPAR
jgi:hypothetical protein